MVVIRLARGGAKKRPFYRIIIADSRSRRDGSFVEKVGYYDPMRAEFDEALCINLDRFDYWVSVGARPSPTVLRLSKEFRKKVSSSGESAA